MSSNKNAAVRYIVLDRCFQNKNRSYSIDDLVEECNEALYNIYGSSYSGIKKRQVYSDIQFMSSENGYNAPIETYTEPVGPLRSDNARKFYRYEIGSNFKIKVKPITKSEAEIFSELIKTFKQFGGLQFEWLEEFETRLESEYSIVANEEKPIISFSDNKYLVGRKFLSKLYLAIKNKECLLLEYHGYKDDSKLVEYVFSPHYLKQFNNRWFVYGFTQGKEGLRNVALDRILNILPGPAEYEDCNIDFEEYLDDIYGVTRFADAPIEEVHLWIANSKWPYIKSKAIHPTQTVVSSDETGVVIRLKVIINYELQSLILSYGNEAAVLKPAHFKSSIQNNLQKSLKNYN